MVCASTNSRKHRGEGFGFACFPSRDNARRLPCSFTSSFSHVTFSTYTPTQLIFISFVSRCLCFALLDKSTRTVMDNVTNILVQDNKKKLPSEYDEEKESKFGRVYSVAGPGTFGINSSDLTPKPSSFLPPLLVVSFVVAGDTHRRIHCRRWGPRSRISARSRAHARLARVRCGFVL